MEPNAREVMVSRVRPWHLLLGGFVLTLLFISWYFLRESRNRALVSGFVASPAENLATLNGRTNFLLLGVGGEGHQAPDLTDSIIFASYKHADSSVTMISLPRDIWVDTLKAKLNTAYHYGNEKRENGGRDLAKSAVAEVLGVPVHYAVILDFDGFVRAIDAVGGIEVEVERTFDDYQYPIPGKEQAEPESARYEHLHFDQGLTHMDGKTALKFARSRYAEGEEGTDFARSRRQQKIILAFKDQILQSKTLLDKEKLDSVIASLSSSVETDLESDDYGSLLRVFLAYEKSGQSITSLDVTDYFENPKNKLPYANQWVLVPTNSWESIHQYVQENLR